VVRIKVIGYPKVRYSQFCCRLYWR